MSFFSHKAERKIAKRHFFPLSFGLWNKNTIFATTKRLRLCYYPPTPTIEGHSIREYKGIVTGETIIGANFMKDFFAGIRDIIGGRLGSYEKVLREAKGTALDEMRQRAADLGANAVVGIDIDYETVGQSGSMLMVAVSGTAVVI